MKLYTEERYLLQLLKNEGKIDLYKVYTETNFSTGQLARFLRTYRRRFYIRLNGEQVQLTMLGRYYIRRMNLYASREDMYWKEIPLDKKCQKGTINEPNGNIKIKRELANRIISTKGCSRPKQ